MPGGQESEASNEVHDSPHEKFQPHESGRAVPRHKQSRWEENGAQEVWMLITYCFPRARRYPVCHASTCECNPWIQDGREQGSHPASCHLLSGDGDNHLKGMHLYRSTRYGSTRDLCGCLLFSADDKHSAEIYLCREIARCGGLGSGPWLVDSAYRQMAYLQEVGALS